MNSVKTVSSWSLLPRAAVTLIKAALRRPAGLRADVGRPVWEAVKLFAAPHVGTVTIAEMGIDTIEVTGPISSFDRLVLAALARRLSCRTMFEIGTFQGETTLALAKNLPDLRIVTLDLPTSEHRRDVQLELTDEYLFRSWQRGIAFQGTPQADRITEVFGDSATFDFSPYRGSIDLVFIDASHSYSYVRADTEAGLQMLAADGTMVWHDYPAYPGVYAWLNEFAATLDRPIGHIAGTGLAVYSRQPLPGLTRLTVPGVKRPATRADRPSANRD